MIPRKPFLYELRRLGFRYKKQKRNTDLYWRPSQNGFLPDLAYVPRTKLYERKYVEMVFRKYGMPEEQLIKFIKDHIQF